MNVDLRVALAETQNKRALNKLLCNPRNADVKHRGGRFFARDARGDWKPITGLLPRLEEAFWPDFDLKKARRLHRCAGIKKQKRPGQGGLFYGSIRGTETHQQLQDYVELDAAAFRKRHPVIHEYTRQILLFVLERMAWRPVLAEFALCEATLRMGTAVDLVCVNEAGKLIFLEIKTGYEDYFKAASGPMHGALADLDNSAYHQAHVQLLASVLCLVRSHGLRSEDLEMYVVLVNDKMLSPHKVNNDFLQCRGAAIYDDLHLFHTRELQARQLRKRR